MHGQFEAAELGLFDLQFAPQADDGHLERIVFAFRAARVRGAFAIGRGKEAYPSVARCDLFCIWSLASRFLA